MQCEKKHEWIRNIAWATKRDFCDCCHSSSGVTRLDGARGKKQVWCPHIWIWDLLEANVLYWRKYLWQFWVFMVPPQWFGAPIVIQLQRNCAPLVPLDTPLRSRGHFCYGVERAKRFVNMHLHCIVSNMERINKISSLPPWKKICGRPCFWLECFQISGIFPTCYGCFLAANTTNKKYLNYRNFNQPFLCNIQSLETWNSRDRNEAWNLRDRDSQKWVSRWIPRPSLETPSLIDCY